MRKKNRLSSNCNQLTAKTKRTSEMDSTRPWYSAHNNETTPLGHGRIWCRKTRRRFCNVNARLATADDGILASTAKAGTNHDQATKPHDPRAQPQEGAIQFESGYLSPHFVNHPERMKLLWRTSTFLVTQAKSAPRTCSRSLRRLQKVANRS